MKMGMKMRIILGLFLIFGILFCFSLVSADNIEIQIKNDYLPGDEMNLKFFVYDDSYELVNGQVNFKIQNYYTDLIHEGSVNSGESYIFTLPDDSFKGLWKVSAEYDGIFKEVLFNVGESEKIEIVLEGDKLIITNVGNIFYNQPLLIFIGEHSETALVPLEIGQRKEIKLTAPSGQYNVKVSDGSEENTKEFDDVSLTGNVIGLEKVTLDNFWKRYPVVGVFLFSLGLVVLVVIGLKIHERYNLKKK